MSEQEIAEASAERLAEETALRVMGWTRDGWLWKDTESKVVAIGVGRGAWDPAGCVEDAWKVVERLRSHFRCTVTLTAYRDDGNPWENNHVSISDYTVNAAGWHAATMPEAVCRCALAWLARRPVEEEAGSR